MKKIVLSSLICAIILTLFTLPAFAADITSGDAVYGTPVVDGKIDEIWEKAPVYQIDSGLYPEK